MLAENAPVSKVAVIACGIASVLVGTQRGAKACCLSYHVSILSQTNIFRYIQNVKGSLFRRSQKLIILFWMNPRLQSRNISFGGFSQRLAFSHRHLSLFLVYILYTTSGYLRGKLARINIRFKFLIDFDLHQTLYLKLATNSCSSSFQVFLAFTTILSTLFNLVSIYILKGTCSHLARHVCLCDYSNYCRNPRLCKMQETICQTFMALSSLLNITMKSMLCTHFQKYVVI